MQNMTNMRLAFTQRTTKPTASAAVENMVARHLLHSRSGLIKDQRPNAALSFRTAKLLGMPECSNSLAIERGRPAMRYDAMVRGEAVEH